MSATLFFSNNAAANQATDSQSASVTLSFVLKKKNLSNVTTADFQHAKVSHVRADEQRTTKYGG